MAEELTPKQIVKELDKYIVGQKKAKRAVAVALRNRMRRLKLDTEMREDITPKNILMIGPTGVGKTEIARRLAKLTGSPFIKIEATKYTEVGYVGRDVESMIRDLMAAGVAMVKEEMEVKFEEQAKKQAEEALLDLLVPSNKKKPQQPEGNGSPVPIRQVTIGSSDGNGPTIRGTMFQLGIPLGKLQDAEQAANGEEDQANDTVIPLPDETGEAEEDEEEAAEGDVGDEEPEKKSAADKKREETREKMRKMLHEGKLEDKMVEIVVNQNPQFPGLEFLGGGMEELGDSLSGIAGIFGGSRRVKNVTVARAREILVQEEQEKLLDRERVSDEARQRVEEMGIVFIDEIDKIASKGEHGGADVSREGVQRDILPIVEGATVNTKWGPVKTDHVLFIAAGAFNVSKPSDLIPELQGRFPLRVELESLGKNDFLRILTEPKNALTKQYVDLLATENIVLNFEANAIERIAILAAEVNSKLENIGARRLHTIMETLLDDISFDAPDIAPATIPIDAAYVNEKLASIAKDQDLGRYIL
ncbi:MAG: ATP-dependent protease ATPase subunit HslU [Spirochaetaceae bacterium]|nr:ATP-dependent protease ATPase subunit HslU [Spirochaetaceae bacterium]